MSKLSDFLEKNKIDPRRVVATSKKVENLRPEDRQVRLARKKVKTNEAKASDADKELAAKASRSGRPVGEPTIKAAMAGGSVSPKAKQRITRAVNQILKTKKKNEVTATDLF